MVFWSDCIFRKLEELFSIIIYKEYSAKANKFLKFLVERFYFSTLLGIIITNLSTDN